MTDIYNFIAIGSGKLDAAEFTAGFATELGGTAEQAAKVFKALDSDGSGDVEVEEMKNFFKKMDDDGRCITYEQYQWI